MEQNQDPTQLQSEISINSQEPSGPKIILQTERHGYFAKLFSGRMNRQNYIIGSTVLVLVPLICFLVVIFNILLSPSALAMPYINPNNPSEIVTPQVSLTSLDRK